MGEVIGLLLVVGALVGIVLFMMKPLGQGSFFSRVGHSGASAPGGPRARDGVGAVVVLVMLQIAQLMYSGALSFVELGHAGLDAATFLVVGGFVIFGATLGFGRKILTLVGAVLGIVNLAIQHGVLAAVSVAVLVMLLVTLAVLVSRFTSAR